MRLLSLRAAPLLILTAMALGACADQTNPTQVKAGEANHRALPNLGDTLVRATCTLPAAIPGEARPAAACGGGGGGGGGGSPPPPPPGPMMNWTDHVPTQLELLSSPGAVSLEVMVSNSQAPVTDVWVSVDVSLGGRTLNVYHTPVVCPNEPAGTLYGNCVMWLYPYAPTTTVPDFPAGAANLHVSMTHHDPTQGGVLLGDADRNSGITLVDSRTKVTAINPTRTAPVIDATTADLYSLTIYNPLATTRSSMSFRYYIKQNSVTHYSGTVSLGCGSLLVSGGTGQLPPGNCNPTAAFAASNTSQPGTLISGAATLGVQVISGWTGQIEGESTVPISLNAAPTIGSVKTPCAAFLNVTGPFAADTVRIQYTGSATILNATVRNTITQNGMSVALPAQSLDCGSGTGTLPNTNGLPNQTCKFVGSFTATAPLVAGNASLQVQLSDPVNGTLATQTIPITIGAAPTIDDGGMDIPAFQPLVIGDPALIPYHASLGNAGSSNLPNVMTLKLIVTQQGGAVARTVGKLTVVCNGVTGIPVGACGVSSTLRMNDTSEDKGTLTAGGATLEFHLIDVVSGKELATPFQKGVTLQ